MPRHTQVLLVSLVVGLLPQGLGADVTSADTTFFNLYHAGHGLTALVETGRSGRFEHVGRNRLNLALSSGNMVCVSVVNAHPLNYSYALAVAVDTTTPQLPSFPRAFELFVGMFSTTTAGDQDTTFNPMNRLRTVLTALENLARDLATAKALADSSDTPEDLAQVPVPDNSGPTRGFRKAAARINALGGTAKLRFGDPALKTNFDTLINNAAADIARELTSALARNKDVMRRVIAELRARAAAVTDATLKTRLANLATLAESALDSRDLANDTIFARPIAELRARAAALGDAAARARLESLADSATAALAADPTQQQDSSLVRELIEALRARATFLIEHRDQFKKAFATSDAVLLCGAVGAGVTTYTLTIKAKDGGYGHARDTGAQVGVRIVVRPPFARQTLSVHPIGFVALASGVPQFRVENDTLRSTLRDDEAFRGGMLVNLNLLSWGPDQVLGAGFGLGLGLSGTDVISDYFLGALVSYRDAVRIGVGIGRSMFADSVTGLVVGQAFPANAGDLKNLVVNRRRDAWQIIVVLPGLKLN